MKKIALLLALLMLCLSGLAIGETTDAPTLESLTLAAEAGDKDAMFALGEGWSNGAFTGTADYDLALEWYHKADAAGHFNAARRIVNLYQKGVVLDDGTVLYASDHAKLLSFLEKKYAEGTEDPYLLSWLGWLLCGNSAQNVCEPDYARAIDVYVKAAYLGDSYSMMRLAEMMLDGRAGQILPEEALYWYKMAYLAGDETALNKIISLYNNGLTGADGAVLLAPDHAAMLAYLEDLYLQDDLNAYGLSWLGWLLCGNSDQDVCEADYHRALEVYLKAAELGDGYSMWQIGNMYRDGRFGASDPVAAEAWLRKAIAAGYTQAQETLDNLLAAQAQ